MSRNIEIKARIASVEVLLPQVRTIADQGPFEILGIDPSQLSGGYLDLITQEQAS